MYCLDLKAITYLGSITLWYFLALALLLDKRIFEKAKRTQYMVVSILFLWCLVALVFGRFAERLYAVVTICGMTAVQILVLRRRRMQGQDKGLGQADTKAQ